MYCVGASFAASISSRMVTAASTSLPFMHMFSRPTNAWTGLECFLRFFLRGGSAAIASVAAAATAAAGRAAAASASGASGAVARGSPALSSALAYFDAYRTGRLWADLIQAQRDYFGAHTFERTDRPGSFHRQWSSS